MALSLSNFLYICSAFIFYVVNAEVRTFNFTIEWVTANPDGLHERPVIGINGQWPIPRIEANVGDRVIVNAYNALGNETTTLHFHGLYMNGATDMDGVAGGTQCPIPPGSTFVYYFTIDQPGTYWYHSHVNGQYPDGIRGPLIVHDPDSPFANQYDEELVLTLSDWYHDEMPTLLKSFINVANPTGAEPVPRSALMNDTQNLTIAMTPGRTYFLRIINMGAFAAQYFWIEDHTVRIIEVDGVYHEPAEASMLYITAAQRYGVLLTAKNTTDKNYAIVGAMDQDLFDTVPDTLNPNVTSFLVYDSSAPLPTPALVDEYDTFDDITLVPYDHQPLLEDPTTSVSLDLTMDNLGNGANYAFFNGITYVRPVVPTLYTVMSSGEYATNSTIYGVNTHSIILGYNETIELVVNNHDAGKHPFHLHGHAFQAIARGVDDAGDWDPEAITNGSLTFPKYPMRRDTFLVRPNGYIVMRFTSTNPGVWLFHCHIEWHVDTGLIMTFIEAPLELQKTLTIPENHFDSCAASSPPMPTVGNAAANTKDFFDLTGANVSIAPLPSGFTARGIVALVFSCLAGILGIIVITWYGVGELNNIEKAKEEKSVQDFATRLGVQRTNTGGVEEIPAVPEK